MKPELKHALTPFFTRLLLASLLLFIMISWYVFIIKDYRLDNGVMHAIQQTETDHLTRFMKWITYYGNHSFLIPANIVLIIVLFYYKQKKWAVCVLLCSLAGVGLMSMLKNLFARHRPAAPFVSGITNYSFPSGHAMMSLLFYGILIVLSFLFVKKLKIKIPLILLFSIIILLIGFSRLYLRVHYTTDVLAGYTMGLCWLSISFLVSNKLVRTD